MGYQDPDAERLVVEAERRRTQGVAGDWEIITPPPRSISLSGSPPSSIPGAIVSASALKREADVPIDEEDNRQFKLRKKTLGSGLGEIYDPGIIPIKLKKPEESATNSLDVAEDVPKPTDAPKWTKVEWKRPGEKVKHEGEISAELLGGGRDSEERTAGDTEERQPKFEREEQSSPTGLSNQKDIDMKLEGSVPALPVPEAGGILFRKRKMPTGASRGKRV